MRAGLRARPQVTYQGVDIDFGQPFRRATMRDLVKEASGIDFGAFSGAEDLPTAVSAAVEALEKAKASSTSIAAVRGSLHTSLSAL